MFPEPIVQAKIPVSYFSSSEQDFNTSALVEILSSVPNSPLTPSGLLQNFTPTFPNATFLNKIGSRVQDFSNLTPANLRYHAMQQQSLQQNVNKNNTSDLVTNEMQTYSNVSPRSMNGNTSGYLSQLSHVGESFEQLNVNAMNNFQQPENQIIIGTPTNIHPFEVDNRLMTPVYPSVSIRHGMKNNFQDFTNRSVTRNRICQKVT